MLVLSLCLFGLPLTSNAEEKTNEYSLRNLYKAFQELSWKKKVMGVGIAAGTIGATGFLAHKGVKAIKDSHWVKKVIPVKEIK